jgi:CYTH domain-containing protein
MSIERERKYILTHMPPLPENHEVHQLLQAYLMIQPGKQLRIRLIDNNKAILCYKQKINTTDRNEFEYQIPYEEGLALYNLAELKLPKTRYSWNHNGQHIDIDIYPDEIGFHIVEIEYTGEEPVIPDFCGRDVSEEEGYSNVSIAKKLQSIG